MLRPASIRKFLLFSVGMTNIIKKIFLRIYLTIYYTYLYLYRYTAPDGTPIEVKFVADENGFQPESSVLPVAPEFPHEIPQFVLDQISKAAAEDAADAAAETQGAYGHSLK